MTKKLITIIGLALATVSIYTSCKSFDKVNEVSKNVSPVVTHLYQLRESENFDSIKYLFSDKFLSKVSGDSVGPLFKKYYHAFGHVETYTLEENSLNELYTTDGKFDEFTQTYRVVYSSGKVTEEALVFLGKDLVKQEAKIERWMIGNYE